MQSFGFICGVIVFVALFAIFACSHNTSQKARDGEVEKEREAKARDDLRVSLEKLKKDNDALEIEIRAARKQILSERDAAFLKIAEDQAFDFTRYFVLSDFSISWRDEISGAQQTAFLTDIESVQVDALKLHRLWQQSGNYDRYLYSPWEYENLRYCSLLRKKLALDHNDIDQHLTPPRRAITITTVSGSAFRFVIRGDDAAHAAIAHASIIEAIRRAKANSLDRGEEREKA